MAERRFETTYDRHMRENPEVFQENLRIERERFGNILTDLLDAAGYQPPARTLTVASVACGCCVEAPVLVDVLGKRGGDRQVNVVGVDSNSRLIEIAQEQAANLPGRHSFKTADARQNSAYGNHEFDVVLFRRQNIGNQPPAWMNIFEAAMDRMGRDSIAIVTSLSGSEHIKALAAFNTVRYEYTPVLDTPLATRYLADQKTDPQEFQLMPIEGCASVIYPVHPRLEVGNH